MARTHTMEPKALGPQGMHRRQEGYQSQVPPVATDTLPRGGSLSKRCENRVVFREEYSTQRKG